MLDEWFAPPPSRAFTLPTPISMANIASLKSLLGPSAPSSKPLST